MAPSDEVPILADYTFYAYSNADLGGLGDTGRVEIGTQVSAGAGFPTITVRDDDAFLDDEATDNFQTKDLSQQVLAADTADHSAGQVIQSVLLFDIDNQTTGESGTLYMLRIYEGTDPQDTGGQDGQYYYAADILLSPGDNFELLGSYFIGNVPYADLVGPDPNCFTKGTLIDTAQGLRQIETLVPGDLIRTKDNELQPLRWTGTRRVSAQGAFAPVVFGAGALGNPRPLVVSPHHRLLLSGWRAEALFGTSDVLVSASALINGQTVYRRTGGQVDYVHLLFDAHEIVFAEGVPSESLHPALDTASLGAQAAREEILALFPQLDTQISSYGPLVHPALSAHEVAMLEFDGVQA